MTFIVEHKKKRTLPRIPQSHPNGFTVKDVQSAGFTLTPIVCGNTECPDPLSGNVEFNQSIGDAYCAICGEWQNDLPGDDTEENLHV